MSKKRKPIRIDGIELPLFPADSSYLDAMLANDPTMIKIAVSALGVPYPVWKNTKPISSAMSTAYNRTPPPQLTNAEVWDIVGKIQKRIARRNAANRLHVAIIQTMTREGYHKDIIERVKFVLGTEAGRQAALSLSIAEMEEPEAMVQKFMRVYDEVSE